jgi:glycopeptide antibiotics resistance protein
MRLFWLVLFLLLFAAEICIALFVHDRFVRPYLGDAFVVVLIYAFVRIFLPRSPKWLVLWVFLFSVVVECLQYIHILQLLHLEQSSLMRVVIGGTFAWGDIACYAAGCLVAFGIDRFVRRARYFRSAHS